MDFLSLALFLLLTVIFLQAVVSVLAKTSRKLPPGPIPLPLVGNLVKLGDKPHRSLAELAIIYGPIMTLKLGKITTVVISSSTFAREVLQKQDLAFSNRFIPNSVHAHNHHQYSSVWLPVGERWRSLRKLMNSNIFSGNRLDAHQNLRRLKVEDLIADVGKSCEEGVPVDVAQAAFTTSLNVLSNTIFSVDLADPSEELAREFKDLVWGIMAEVGKPNLADYFPVLARIDPQGIRSRATNYFGKVFDLFSRLIDQRVEERRLTKNNKSERDVIDILLNISEEENNEQIDRTHIEHLCLDLFAAGTDTTSSTVEWAMAELLRNPETLKEAKAELEKTIGKGKPVQESDVPRLPYLRGIVKETLRMHPSVPLLIPRKVVETDVEVFGYTVPKEAQVLVNVWAIGRDQSIWLNPNSFMPERFLGSDIDVRGQDFELIPFGAGRRICPGLPLAIRIVHLMLGSLINCFDWKLEGGIGPKGLDMDEKFGITLQKAQPLRAVPIHV